MPVNVSGGDLLVVGVSQVPCLDEYQVCIITGRQGGKVVYLEGHGESQGDEYRADDILHDDEQAAEQFLLCMRKFPFTISIGLYL